MDVLDVRARQLLIDQVESPSCVVGSDGVLQLVNRAWRGFGEANGARGMDGPLTDGTTCCGVGADYHTWLDDPTDDLARRSARGMFDVIAGRLEQFDMVYPCHGPDERRWFRLLVTPLTDSAPRPVLAVHVRLGEIHGAREFARGVGSAAPERTVCAWCNAQVRSPDGTWSDLVVPPPADVAVSHGICPGCASDSLADLHAE